jgi:hypothetical protein
MHAQRVKSIPNSRCKRRSSSSPLTFIGLKRAATFATSSMPVGYALRRRPPRVRVSNSPAAIHFFAHFPALIAWLPVSLKIRGGNNPGVDTPVYVSATTACNLIFPLSVSDHLIMDVIHCGRCLGPAPVALSTRSTRTCIAVLWARDSSDNKQKRNDVHNFFHDCSPLRQCQHTPAKKCRHLLVVF